MRSSYLQSKHLSKYALSISLFIFFSFTAIAEVKTTLGNGSFEDPVIGGSTWLPVPEANVPFWSTNDPSNNIEFWNNNFLGAPSADGNQHNELNSTQASSISQNLCIAAGDVISWSYKHRARESTAGTPNEINLSIGGVDQGNHTAPTAPYAWETVSGTFTPATTGSKAFVLTGITPIGGSGNLLDDIQVSGVAAFVEFSSANYSDSEDNGGNIPLLLIAGEITTATTVDVTVTGGTATSGSDFTNTITVTIPVGIYDGTPATGIPINLAITSDNLFEPDETIDFSISSTGAGINVGNVNTCGDPAQQTTTYTILNDDAAQVPTLSEWAIFVLTMLLAFVGYKQARAKDGGIL